MLWTQGCVGFTPLKEVTAVVNSFYASVNFTFWCFPWFCCWLVLLMWIACIEVGCVEPVLVRSSSAKKRKGHCNQNRRMKLSACIINVFEKKQLLISMCWLAFNLLNVSGPHSSFSTFLFWGFMILQGNWDISLCAKECQGDRKNGPETAKSNESFWPQTVAWLNSLVSLLVLDRSRERTVISTYKSSFLPSLQCFFSNWRALGGAESACWDSYLYCELEICFV